MPFLGSIGHNGINVSAAILARHRLYTPAPAGGNTEWIRVLGLPRLSFDVQAAVATPYTLEYTTSGGTAKVIVHPGVFATGPAFDLHLPARWVRFAFPALAGPMTVNLRASGTS